MVAGVATVLPAQAADTDPVTTTTSTREEVMRVGKQDIEEARHKTPAGMAEGLTKGYALSQARQGRLVDARSVRSAVLPRGASVTWETGIAPDLLVSERHVVRSGAREEGDIHKLGLEVSEVTGPRVQPTVTVGAGMSTAFGVENARRGYATCWGGGDGRGNNVTGCAEKWDPHQDGSTAREYYLFNRYGTASGHTVSFFPDYTVQAMTMESRPSRHDPTSIRGMAGYWPNTASEQCAAGGSVGIGFGSMTGTINLHNCAGKAPRPDPTAKSMKMLYGEGSVRDFHMTEGLDYTHILWTWRDWMPYMGFRQAANFCSSKVTCQHQEALVSW